MGRILLLIVVTLLLLAHHAFYFYGHFGADDMTYANMAYHLFRGEVDFTHPFAFRIVPVFVLAICYQLFGVNDWASALPALACSVGVAALLVYYLRRYPVWVSVLALAACYGMRWNFFYSDKIMADVYVCFCGLGAWIAYLTARRRGGPGVAMGTLAAVLLFVGFNAKGSVVLLAPLFAANLLYDMLRRKRYRFWTTFMLACAGLLTGFLLLSRLLFGSALARFQAIENHRYLNPCSYDVLPLEHLVDRLTTDFYFLLADSGMLVHGIVAVVSLVLFAVRGGSWLKYAYFPLTALLCLLSANFMTISFNSYNPVCLDPRHTLMFAPILAACTAVSVLKIAAVYEMNTKSPVFLGAIGIASVVLLYPSYKLANYSATLNYAVVKEHFIETLDRLEGPAIVVGSRVTKPLSEYFMQFGNEERGLYFRDLRELSDCGRGTSDTTRYLIQSWYPDFQAEVGRMTFDTTLMNRGWERKPSSIDVPDLEVYLLECAE